MTKKIWDVMPNGRGGWSVKREGTRRAARAHDRKDDALAHAKQLAHHAGDAQVRVKGLDGRIQQEWTYGHDPRRTRG